MADIQAVLSAMRAEAAANAELIKARLAQQDEAIRAIAGELRQALQEIRALRSDFQEFKTEVRVEFQTVRTEMQVIRTEMQALRADTERTLNAHTWKMLGTIFAVNSGTIAIVYHLVNHG